MTACACLVDAVPLYVKVATPEALSKAEQCAERAYKITTSQPRPRYSEIGRLFNDIANVMRDDGQFKVCILMIESR